MREKIKYSVILPVYNEEKSLEVLTRRLIRVLDNLKDNWEIIFVDDGSKDNSLEVIKKICQKNKKVKAIRLRKNFGKSTALTCGFKFSSGEIVFTMDADLQDQPEDIPKFLKKLNQGYDLVSGWKKKRKDPLNKIIASRIFNFFTAKFTGVRIHDFNCGFKAYKKEAIANLDFYGDLFRFIPALVAWQGFKVGEIEVSHSYRRYGRSKFGHGRMVRGFFDLFTIIFIIRFLKRPLHLFGIFGLLFFMIGFLINLYLTILWFSGEVIGHRPLLTLGVLLMIIGFQFVSTGLLGEMLTYFQTRAEKEYPIAQKIGNFSSEN